MPGPVLALASLRYAWRHPWQLALALAGVALGVAVVTAVDLSIASSRIAFERAHEAVAGRATHVLRADPAGVDEVLYADLKRRGLSARLAPVVEGYVTVPGTTAPRTLRILGVDLFAEAPFRPHLGEAQARGWLGELLSRPDGALMSTESARSLGLAVGARFTVRAGGRPHSLELLGLMEASGGLAEAALSDLVVMDIAAAQELFDRIGRLSRVDVVAEGAGERDALAAALPPGVELRPAGRRQEVAAEMARAFELNLRMLGLLSLVVGAFLIYNTMAFSVLRRRTLIAHFRMLGVTRGGVFCLLIAEALALLSLVVGAFLIYNTMAFSVLRRRTLIAHFRMLGVTRGGVFCLLIAEALALTAIASACGIALGALLAGALLDLVTRSLNDHYFVVAVSDVHLDVLALLKGFVLGMGTGMIGAAFPALEATRVSPRLASLPSVLEARSNRLSALGAGLGAFCLAGGILLLGLPSRDALIGFAALAGVVLGCVLLAPGASRVFLHAVWRLARRRRGILPVIAARSAAAGLTRSAVAVGALMVALAATVGVGVMVDSFRRSVEVWLDRTLRADLYIGVPGRGWERTLPAGLAEAVRRLPGVEEVSRGRVLPVDSEHGPARLFVIEMAQRSYAAFEFLEGTGEAAWPAFDTRDAVLASEPHAWRNGLHAGDGIVLSTPAGRRRFEVAGVYRDYETSEGTLLMGRATYLRHWPDRGVSGIGVYLSPGGEVAGVAQGIRALLPADREIVLRPRGDIRRASLDVFDRTFAITGVLRWLACTVAFLGVLSALLALSLERAREVAVMRAIGLTRREVFVLAQTETGLLGLAAGFLSIPTGLAMALLLILVINRRSFGWGLSVHVDPVLCLQALGLAVLAALLAGLFPAWRMARRPPAVALRSE